MHQCGDISYTLQGTAGPSSYPVPRGRAPDELEANPGIELAVAYISRWILPSTQLTGAPATPRAINGEGGSLDARTKLVVVGNPMYLACHRWKGGRSAEGILYVIIAAKHHLETNVRTVPSYHVYGPIISLKIDEMV